MELKNRHILITGASRGIGRAFARVCAADKAHVHLVLRSADAEIISELESAGAKSVHIWQADLSSKDSINLLLENLREQQIDILFNNAGVLTGGLLETQSIDDIYNMNQVNITALMHLTRGLLPAMLKKKRGKIINNSSVAGFMALPAASTYAASKAAVAAFTNCLNLELKGTGVSTLLLITPGIKTQMYEEVEALYSKNYSVPKKTLSPSQYAEMIREAVIEDLEVLQPSGIAGLGLKVAKFVPQLFKFGVQRSFKR